MPSFTSRTITSIRREWIVPAAEPWGATGAEIGKAWSAAEAAYREHYNLPADRALSDDALRFHVTDDTIVITFTTEEPAR
ncbi:hypothetical protein [Streptomyces sp. NBC_00338]|uniref:hypothetical protein n=1 Tax=Streptomyces sp. NBC_00338 TaxID=2975715 RepID=UPI00225BF177|nr:hypothetical protein [Streptomyces sp. NBC_00338]MCX5138346.1 hypothetical protein [Streptomyces sp. NBC_00338]MCX5145135.1 hypothetical protein [Streptomyces sp. NBC_00338]